MSAEAKVWTSVSLTPDMEGERVSSMGGGREEKGPRGLLVSKGLAQGGRLFHPTQERKGFGSHDHCTWGVPYCPSLPAAPSGSTL